jgi:PD-(D/E)XK nuclease superfamily
MLVTDRIIVPSKWDVIPVHASDRGTWKFCRRQWTWSSPTRRNLIPKTHVHGIRIPLWFGSGIHYALERYYNPVLHEDPETTFRTWFSLEWNGGLITEAELPQYVDRFPELTWHDSGLPDNPPVYRIKGLNEILPAPDEEQFAELLDLGCGMLRFYKDYAEREDNFTVVATEHDFSVPVVGPNGNALYLKDKRKMPEGWEPSDERNEFGRLTLESGYKQVHARGRMDMIIQDNETGLYGVMDHKTTSRLDDDYFRNQELDEQATSYLTFGEMEARLWGLPYKNLEFITFQGLFKGYPKPPTITSRGLPSIDRNNESTTAEMFAQCIDELGLRVVYENDIKWQNYYEWLLQIGERRFIDRKSYRRNWQFKRNAAMRVYYEAMEMLSDPVCYPNPTKNYGCLNCVFRAPCIAAEDGSDYDAILKDGYMPNWDR